jgi:hypothetical protein
MINKKLIATQLINQYHQNPDAFSEDQAERLALMAFTMNIPFRPETKKLSKFVFELANTATLGLTPNSWRPRRVAEHLYGETQGEKIAGGLGTLMGLAIPIGGGIKAFNALRAAGIADKSSALLAKGWIVGKQGAKDAGARAVAGYQAAMARAAPMAQSAVTRATPYAQRGVAQARAAGASGRRRLTDMINDPLGVGKIDLSNLGY